MLRFIIVSVIGTVALNVASFIQLYAITSDAKPSRSLGDPLGTVLFYAIYAVPASFLAGALIGVVAYLIARALMLSPLTHRLVIAMAGLFAAAAALGSIFVPLVGMGTNSLLLLGAGIATGIFQRTDSGTANLAASIALSLAVYIGLFLISSRYLTHSADMTKGGPK